MFVRFRSARPTDRLPALRRFYVDALGLSVLGEWTDHEGFDGLVVGDARAGWQAEFIHEHAHPAPPAPGPEHLLVFYVADRAALAQRAAAMDAAGCRRVAPNNPYWARCGVTYEDPDGYPVVIAVPPAALQSP
jgi:catechol 2,3-dioxygenase-like lactoylglutathione lyase family enzyme